MNSAIMATTFSCDETPTPTGLIRHFEEAGFFQDLQSNPFEETFRNAAANNDISSLIKDPVPKTVTEETLNTPRVLPPMKTNNYAGFLDEDDNISDCDFLEPILPNIQYDDGSKNEMNSEESSNMEIIEECQADLMTENSPYLSSLNNSNHEDVKVIVKRNPHNKVSIVRDFLFDSKSLQAMNDGISNEPTNESVKQTINDVINIRKSTQNVIDKSMTNLVTSPMTNSSNVGTFLKLQNVQRSTISAGNVLYKLVSSNLSEPTVIDGNKIIIVPSKPIQNAKGLPVSKISPKETRISEDSTSLVKQKLKTMLSNGDSSQTLDNVGNSNNLENVMIVSDSGETEDMDDNRKEHSKERNRMAQKRCRLKKKRWILQLKNETELVMAKNNKLQNEITSLKAEIAHLKTLLLAHRNCSVTRAMYKTDLNAILSNDVSDIVEDIEVPAADDLEDTSTNVTQITINNNHCQITNHNQIHFHVPPSLNLNDSELSLAPDLEQIEQPSSLLRQLNSINSQFDRSKKLVCDSKVVPIKPTDRSLNKCYRKAFRSTDSKVLTTRNMRSETETTTTEAIRKPKLKIYVSSTETSSKDSEQEIIENNVSAEK